MVPLVALVRALASAVSAARGVLERRAQLLGEGVHAYAGVLGGELVVVLVWGR